MAEPSGARNIAVNDDQFQRSLDVPDEEPDPMQSRIIVPFSTLLVVSAMSLGFASGMMNGARHTALVYLAEMLTGVLPQYKVGIFITKPSITA